MRSAVVCTAFHGSCFNGIADEFGQYIHRMQSFKRMHAVPLLKTQFACDTAVLRNTLATKPQDNIRM